MSSGCLGVGLVLVGLDFGGTNVEDALGATRGPPNLDHDGGSVGIEQVLGIQYNNSHKQENTYNPIDVCASPQPKRETFNTSTYLPTPYSFFTFILLRPAMCHQQHHNTHTPPIV